MELKEANEKTSQHKFLTWIIIVFAVALVIIGGLSYYLIFLFPENQVSQLGITNITEKANFINQYRTTSIQLISTFAQILGGIVVVIGIYFAWGNQKVSQDTLISYQKKVQDDLKVAQDTLEANIKIAQENLKVAQEGQITERFTRAIDQIGANDQSGNPAIEIRLGGIYALERISIESEKDYWPIMEILTAYIRKNSNIIEFNNSKDPISVDIQTILTILKKRKFFYENGESESLDLRKTFLQGANLRGANLQSAFLQEANLINAKFTEANLEGACLLDTNCTESYFVKANLKGANFAGAILRNARLEDTNLQEAYFSKANLSGADFSDSILHGAIFEDTNLEEAYFRWANLEDAIFCRVNLQGAIFEGSNLSKAIFQEADLKGADLKGADLKGADLIGAKNLTVDQLSDVETLYEAKLDPEKEAELRAKGFGHLLDDEPKNEP